MDFSTIRGWNDGQQADALGCFLKTAERAVEKPHSTKSLGADGQALADIGQKALEQFGNRSDISDLAARSFFEENFQPFEIRDQGFITGYFEPELLASRTRSDEYSVPIYRRPPDLADINDDTRPNEMDPYFMFAREEQGNFSSYHNRREINQGALDGRGLEIFWLKDPVDCYFMHIQGSARLILTNGTTQRVSYAAKSGHPYSAIGKYLVSINAMKLEDVTMATLKQWLRDNPTQMFAAMEENQSYIFFQETILDDPDLGPVAAGGVPLTSGCSLAIDHKMHTFGTPIFVNSQDSLPGEENPFSRLMIAQDTGSAIVGSARGDVFIGSGDRAGEIAGAIKFGAEFIALFPRNQSVVQ